jgi:predicted DNA-binding transcriptional regulator AlpA
MSTIALMSTVAPAPRDPAAPYGDDTLLTTQAAAKLCGVHKNTLLSWHKQGIGPKFLKLGPRRILVRLRDIKEFLRSCEVEPRVKPAMAPTDTRKVTPQDTAEAFA